MTDITELAQRLKLEVHRAVSNFNPQMNIKTRDLKELVEALEKAQAKNALVAGGIEAATKLHERIAYLEKRLRGTEESLIASTDMVTELESRTVKLPEPVGVVGNDHWIGEMNMRSAVIQALKSAGIKREDE